MGVYSAALSRTNQYSARLQPRPLRLQQAAAYSALKHQLRTNSASAQQEPQPAPHRHHFRLSAGKPQRAVCLEARKPLSLLQQAEYSEVWARKTQHYHREAAYLEAHQRQQRAEAAESLARRSLNQLASLVSAKQPPRLLQLSLRLHSEAALLKQLQQRHLFSARLKLNLL